MRSPPMIWAPFYLSSMDSMPLISATLPSPKHLPYALLPPLEMAPKTLSIKIVPWPLLHPRSPRRLLRSARLRRTAHSLLCRSLDNLKARVVCYKHPSLPSQRLAPPPPLQARPPLTNTSYVPPTSARAARRFFGWRPSSGLVRLCSTFGCARWGERTLRPLSSPRRLRPPPILRVPLFLACLAREILRRRGTWMLCRSCPLPLSSQRLVLYLDRRKVHTLKNILWRCSPRPIRFLARFSKRYIVVLQALAPSLILQAVNPSPLFRP
mmetsp:Transcript_31325/g.75714  ORF Transcript_31325/g.75714 Transcript_31325/m.75714 type:complete len:267 (-) Transcript_31325:893-1693(-)